MIFDTDDLTGDSDITPLYALKEANPAFKVTAFAIPARCSNDFILSLPKWIQPVMHGFEHGDPPTDGGECKDWTAQEMFAAIIAADSWVHSANGFKAPGWKISDGCYRELKRIGWWVADHPENNERRPAGLLANVVGDPPEHVHTHVTDCCGNGLQERFADWLALVEQATEFKFVSEVVAPWRP